MGVPEALRHRLWGYDTPSRGNIPERRSGVTDRATPRPRPRRPVSGRIPGRRRGVGSLTRRVVTLTDSVGLEPLAADMARVEARLHGAVQSPDAFLTEVADHLAQAGGKRLRPMLSLCTAYLLRDPTPVSDHVITGAVSIELVHIGSLYHDDVIDEAQTRRGVESVNARWSNIHAILVGDFLLARASSLAASLGAEVAGLLAHTIGELCRGQVLELQHVYDPQRSIEVYLSAIEGKTAALLASACRVAGLVEHASPEMLDAVTSFGHHLGMCFQIVDDVLDVTRSSEELGKPAGNDMLEGIYTLPVLYAMQSNEELRTLLQPEMDADQLARARELVAANGAIDAAVVAARDHARAATAVLRDTPGFDPTVVASLTQLVDDLIVRTN